MREIQVDLEKQMGKPFPLSLDIALSKSVWKKYHELKLEGFFVIEVKVLFFTVKKDISPIIIALLTRLFGPDPRGV